MKQFISIVLCALGLCTAYGQAEMPLSHSNSLGLPLIPQVPVAATPKGASAAGTAPSRKSVPVAKPDPKSSLSGPVAMASYYEPEGVVRVRVTTGNSYAVGDARKTALAGALLMQRDVALSCGKRCKTLPAPAPAALASGQIQIDLLIQGLDRKLSGPDMIQMVKGLPLPESTDEEKMALVSAAVVSVNKVAVESPATAPTQTPTAANAPILIPLGAAVVSASNRETRTSGTPSLLISR
jgi:hypothetical protein